MEDTYSDVWCLNMKSIINKLGSEALPDTNYWQLLKVSGTGPGKISNQQLVVIESSIYMYGGLLNNENVKQSLYTLDTIANAWSKITFNVLSDFTIRLDLKVEMDTAW